jgi:hypothetical protein
MILSTYSVVIAIYVDSTIFVAGTAILANGFGVDSSKSMCEKAILLCLGCYLTTKATQSLLNHVEKAN